MSDVSPKGNIYGCMDPRLPLGKVNFFIKIPSTSMHYRDFKILIPL